MTKKVGIALDNYKVKAYKKELKKEGFKVETQNRDEHITVLSFMAPEDRLKDIESILQKAESNILKIKAN